MICHTRLLPVMKYRDIVVATTNQGKLKEIKEALRDLPLHLFSFDDFPPTEPIIEDGVTFEENALKKARAVAVLHKKMVIADDSGLEVQALGGRPGIFSARFAGEGASDQENNAHLLDLMQNVPDQERDARFVCVIAFVDSFGAAWTVHGNCSGKILKNPVGDAGFGYDPLFYHLEQQKTFAEIPSAAKLAISHRGRALRGLRKKLLAYIMP
jgi:XTP/dITP diphosphohydrolase